MLSLINPHEYHERSISVWYKSIPRACNRTEFAESTGVSVCVFDTMSSHLVVALICVLSCADASATEPNADEERTRYDNYHLYDVTPSTAEHLQLLDELWRTSDSHVFLQTSRHLGSEWLLVVAPHKLADFHATLNAAGVAHRRRLDDLQVYVVVMNRRQNMRS